jgi:hypothetical protein
MKFRNVSATARIAAVAALTLLSHVSMVSKARAEGPAAPAPAAPQALPATPTNAAPVLATGSGIVVPGRAGRLAEITATTGVTSTAHAGAARDVAVVAGALAMARPAAGLRTQRRMNAERVLADVAPDARACSEAATVRAAATPTFALSVLPTGEVESAVPSAAAGTTPETLACVAVALRKLRFGAPGGAGARLVVPIALVPVKSAPVRVADAPAAPVAPIAPIAPAAPEPIASAQDAPAATP